MNDTNSNHTKQNQSEQLNDLAAAFSKAQGEFGTVEQNRKNPFFKSSYADLDAIIRAVKPSLVKNNLCFYQYTSTQEGVVLLHSRLLHASGQWIESQTPIKPPKPDIQSYGSTMSYQKRYAAQTLLGITTSDDPTDDDGTSIQSTYSPKITTSQLVKLNEEIGSKGFIKDAIKKKLGISSLSDMKISDYDRILNTVKKMLEPSENK